MAKLKFRPSSFEIRAILKGIPQHYFRHKLHERIGAAYGRTPWYMANFFRHGKDCKVLFARLLIREEFKHG